MNLHILCVDDEPNVLAGLERILGFDFEIETATSGAAGLELLRSTKQEFAVVVSDMRMPGMDGAAFLAQVREVAPHSVRMLLTGHADMNAAISAVNEGQIFRFLTKPCPPPLLRQNIEAACEQHRLLRSEKELLEGTLRGAVRLLAEVLSLVNPQAFARAERVARYVRQLCEHVDFAADLWMVEVAALLSQIGCVGVPPDILAKRNDGGALSPAESQIYQRHPQLARQLLANVPRLELIGSIIEAAHDSDTLDKLELATEQKARVRWGANVLELAQDLDSLVLRGKSLAAAIPELPERHLRFDRRIAETLQRLVAAATATAHRLVAPTLLEVGMTLDEDFRGKNGLLLVARGQCVTETLRQRLQLIAERDGLEAPIRVLLA